jgi:TonB-linked SusC/RagA family outer membrane protein
MKNFTFTLILLVGLVSSHWTLLLAQTDRPKQTTMREEVSKLATFRLNNVSYEKALRKVAKAFDLGLAFDPTLLPKGKVTLNVQATTVNNALDLIMTDTKVEAFVSKSSNITLRKKVSFKSVAIEQAPPVDRNITGRVTDAQTGEPLPGASIQVKGTNNGTSTDAEGRYSLTVTDENKVLIVSYIGYDTREIAIRADNTINIDLSPNTSALKEVVVVGYGTQQRKDLTGSVASINGSKITEVKTAGFDQSLQGRVAGLQVFSATGLPGGSTQIRIRGASSVTGGNEPLVVLDGIPLFGTDGMLSRNISDGAAPNPEAPAISVLSTLNPADIESVDVLKDASATAIYGARAANGVIIVTTKRGTAGRPILDVNASYGIQELNKVIPMANAFEFAQMDRLGSLNRSTQPNPISNLSTDSLRQVIGTQYGTDWQKEAYRVAPMLQVNAAIRGGSENTQYNVSGSVLRQDGIVIRSFFNRYTLRANIDTRFGERFKIGISPTFTYQDGNLPQDNHFGERSMLLATLNTSPQLPVYHPIFGDFAFGPNGVPGSWGGGFVNPIRLLNQEDYTVAVTRFTGTAFAELELLKGLTLRASFGTDLLRNRQTTYRANFDNYRFLTNEVVSSAGVRWKETYTGIQNLLNEETLTFTRSLGNHDITVLAGFTAQSFFNNYTSADARGASNNALRTFEYNQGTIRIEGSERNARLLSYFGRVQYDFQDKYLLTATVRRDGSSRFGENNRFGTFPSVSAGWRISEEGFLQNSNWLDNLKIRGSYGLTGNQDIGDFRFLSLSAGTAYAWGNTLASASAPASIGNPNLQWEANEQWDLGLDLSLFKNKLNITADYYERTANDLLLQIPVPLTVGTTIDPTVNLGSVRNRGLELSLSTDVNVGNFAWQTSFNFATADNKIISLGANPAGGRNEYFGIFVGVQGVNGPVSIAREGAPIGAFFGWVADGVFQTNEEAAGHPKTAWASTNPELQVRAGDVRYRDLNGDGVINDRDRTILGSPVPDFFGGWDNTFRYKDLSLSVFLTYQIGHELYNYGRQNSEFNTKDYYENFWSPNRTTGTLPRPASGMGFHNNTIVSSRWVEDASFVRIRSVNLTYSLPEKWMTKLKMTGAALNVNATNLFTFTDYKGYDPEVSSRGLSALNNGVDLVGFPQARVYTVGLNAKF